MLNNVGNVLPFIERFNNISKWVAATILSERKLFDRVKVVSLWIVIASVNFKK